MTGKKTKKTDPGTSGQTSENAGSGAGPQAAPEKAAGITSRLTDAQKEMLASKSRGGGAGSQSVGHSHQPTHTSGKLGPTEKKVRW